MSFEWERYDAVAYADGEQVGEIEDVPGGNLIEFVGAHTTRTPWDPGQEADRIEIERRSDDGE